MDDSVVHLAGNPVRLGDRIIQRCLICGEKLCDNAGLMFELAEDGTVPNFPIWEVGSLVEHSGSRWSVVGQTDNPNFEAGCFPERCCIELVE